MYALHESQASYQALLEVRPNRRPFVISRSTFPGQGQFGGHWTGDNSATFYDMYKSISDILSFNMFGIPMVGADICGFTRASNSELCQRWFQLGAFYPFSRSHNDIAMPAQDPAAFGDEVLHSTIAAYNIRYSLLPYYYTLFFRSHRDGHTVVRPVFFEFPDNRYTYGIDDQFLVGPALMVSPVLEQGATNVMAYFPQTTWFYFNGRRMTDTGGTFNLPAPLSTINLNYRAGYIIPMQAPALTTTLSRRNPFWLLVAQTRDLQARGELYWDDGDSQDSFTKGTYNLIEFRSENNTVSSTLVHAGYKEEAMILGNITVLGVLSVPTSVSLDGHSTSFNYSQRNEVLSMTQLRIDLSTPFTLSWTL